MEPVTSDRKERGQWREFEFPDGEAKMYVVGERVDGGPLECVFRTLEDERLQWVVPNLNWTVEKKEGRFLRLVAQPRAPASCFVAAKFFFEGSDSAVEVYLFRSHRIMREFLATAACTDKFDHHLVSKATLQRIRGSLNVRTFGSLPIELPDFMSGGTDCSGEPPCGAIRASDGDSDEPPCKRRHVAISPDGL